jgi:hypothetical protein
VPTRGTFIPHDASYRTVDEVWFDHDLAVGDTVRPVVEWTCQEIKRDHEPEIGTVIVHSSNPAVGNGSGSRSSRSTQSS